MTDQEWRKSTLKIDATIQQAIANIDAFGIKITLIMSGDDVLLGTLSDGDIRRGLLKGCSLSDSIKKLIKIDPLVVGAGTSRAEVKKLMLRSKVYQIPIVDDKNKILGLHLWDRINQTIPRKNTMVIMAGGLGTRLRPHTEQCPKPMLPVAGKPMLEHIIERAKLDGITKFLLSVNYLKEMIEEYFGDGSKFGVRIDYLREDCPLGTAGALKLIAPLPCEALIVTNGDILTDVRYGDVLDFHLHRNAKATMAVRLHEWRHPYGVLKLSQDQIIGVDEKPITRTHINAGVYVLDPEVIDLIPAHERYDMTSLFIDLANQHRPGIAYPIYESWLDVAGHDDLSRANTIYE